MIEQESDRLVSQLLDELGPADPPAGFARNVMTRIISERHAINRRTVTSNKEGSAMTRRAMWGLAAAAAVTLAVFTIKGFPTVGRGTEGAIGAAKKYEAPQIASQDVVLGDAAAQEFLQSAEFDRLMKDPDARSLLTSAALMPYLRDARFLAAFRDSTVRDVMANRAVAELFDSSDAKAALQAELKGSAAAAAVSQASANAAVNATARSMVMRALTDRSVAAALKSDAVWAALSDKAVRDKLRGADAAAALKGNVLAAAAAQRGFAAAGVSGRLESALAPR